MDYHGRVADRHVLRTLNWAPGAQLTLAAAARWISSSRTSGRARRVLGKGYSGRLVIGADLMSIPVGT